MKPTIRVSGQCGVDPHSPLTAPDRGVLHHGLHPGQRAPVRQDEVPVGSGNTPRFAVFAEADAGTAELLKRFPDLLEAEVRKPFAAGGLWLVRPDGYVAVAAKHGDVERLSSYLDQLTRP